MEPIPPWPTGRLAGLPARRAIPALTVPTELAIRPVASCQGPDGLVAVSDGSGAAWACRTPPLQGLDLRFAVRSTDPVLGNRIGRVLASLRAPTAGPVTQWYGVRTHGSGAVDVDRDGTPVVLAVEPAAALDWLLWDANRTVAAASGRRLLLHAGAVSGPGGGVLLPGASGAGKSTLVATLVRAGFGYLTDELVGMSAPGGRLLPFPRALTIKPGSFAALADLGGAVVGADGDGDRDALGAWHLPPDAIRLGSVSGPCLPRAVVVPRFEPGARPSLRSLGTATAFTALATCSLNLPAHGEVGTRVLAEVARRCQAFEVVFGDAQAACDLVLAAVGS